MINGNLDVILHYKAVIIWLSLTDFTKHHNVQGTQMRFSLTSANNPNGNNFIKSKPLWQG